MPKVQRDINGILLFSDEPEFRPNVTPQEMFELGIFGGTYWLPIYSSVLNTNLSKNYLEFKFLRNLPKNLLTNIIAQKSINYFGVLSGTSLEYWELHNWITPQDPYGWVQWYCRFYDGRRSPDDARQIARWLAFAGPRGRFSSRKNKTPVVKQALLQWGKKF